MSSNYLQTFLSVSQNALAHGQLKRWTRQRDGRDTLLLHIPRWATHSILIIKTATFIVHTRVKKRKSPESLALSACIFRKKLPETELPIIFVFLKMHVSKSRFFGPGGQNRSRIDLVSSGEWKPFSYVNWGYR